MRAERFWQCLFEMYACPSRLHTSYSTSMAEDTVTSEIVSASEVIAVFWDRISCALLSSCNKSCLILFHSPCASDVSCC